MRTIIAGLHISLDGFIEGPNGEQDWVEAWDDPYGLSNEADTCLLGGGMYPGYERYWTAIMTRPDDILPFSGKRPTPREISYAAFARKAPHIVLSTTLESAAWANTRIVRDFDAVRACKAGAGKPIYAVGGAGLISTLINAGMIDELRLIVHPLLLGGGKSPFKGLRERHLLKPIETKPLASGDVALTFRPLSAA